MPRGRRPQPSRRISIGHFRRQIWPSASAIREQKQWSSAPPWCASRQYRIYSDNARRLHDSLSYGAKTVILSLFLAGVRWSQDDAIGGGSHVGKCSNFAKSAAIFKKHEQVTFCMSVTSGLNVRCRLNRCRVKPVGRRNRKTRLKGATDEIRYSQL
jgi:hypothetical protein